MSSFNVKVSLIRQVKSTACLQSCDYPLYKKTRLGVYLVLSLVI